MKMRTNQKRLPALLLIMVLTLGLLLGSAQGTMAAAKKGAGDYYLKINKGTNVVTVYRQDGTPYTAFTCSIGYATPVGTFYTLNKYRWHTLQGPCYGQYCTRITGSILFHSVWYYQQSKNAQSYREYNKLGTTASHGCCRLTVAAGKWIYENCPLRTKVIIFNGSAKDDPLGKPKTIKVKGSRGWDPTDPASDNPYKTGSAKPKITVSKKVLAYGSKFGDGNMTCVDSGGFDITKWVRKSGKVNTKKVGSYRVTYSVVDSFGRSAAKTVTYKVVDKKAAVLLGVKKTLDKKIGTTRNMLTGLKAKDSLGVNLTARIRVYVKAPGAESYEKTEQFYTFEQAGVYHVKYVVVNPNNKKKTVKKQTITVIDDKTPVLLSESEWENLTLEHSGVSLTWSELMEGVSAALADGTDITNAVEISITSPDGERQVLSDGESYVFAENGSYEVIYRASNPKTAKYFTEQIRIVSVTADEGAGDS